MKQLKLFITFLLLTLLSTGLAQATVVFSNFGPGDTFTHPGWTVSGVNGNPDGEFTPAMGFTPSVTANLESIDFAIGLISGTNELDLSLVVSDSLGAPFGPTLESWTFANQMGAFSQTGTPILTADSILNPLLQAGSVYWLVAAAPISDTWAAWNLNSIGDTVAGTVLVSIDGGKTFGPPPPGITPTRGVFRVNAVPEPATILLLGSGLIGLGYGRKKFFKK